MFDEPFVSGTLVENKSGLVAEYMGYEFHGDNKYARLFLDIYADEYDDFYSMIIPFEFLSEWKPIAVVDFKSHCNSEINRI